MQAEHCNEIIIVLSKSFLPEDFIRVSIDISMVSMYDVGGFHTFFLEYVLPSEFSLTRAAVVRIASIRETTRGSYNLLDTGACPKDVSCILS
jgi:hypothetical protein